MIKNIKKVSLESPIVKFRNGKSFTFTDYIVRAALTKMDNAGVFEPCGKGNCQVCDHVIVTNTFKTEACGKVFKIQVGFVNCNLEKVLYLLRCKICDDNSYVGKAKTKFRLRFNNYKNKRQSFPKGAHNVSK